MKVVEQFFDVRSGERGRREIERPDVISEEAALQREPALERERRRAELRAQMRDVLVDQALGLDVRERMRELCRLLPCLALVATLLTGCAWYPIARIPADKEGALVVRCREVKGWFGRDSHWLMVVWVWSKTGTIPDNPGNLEIDGECAWRVEREPGPQSRSALCCPAQPSKRDSNLTRSRRQSSGIPECDSGPDEH